MQAAEFVESYFAAWNHRDPHAVVEHLSADGIYVDIPENARRSHDDWIYSLTEFFAKSRQRYELVGEILTGANSIAFQYRILSLDSRDSKDPDNTLYGAEFIALNGEAAKTITDYYDEPALHEPVDLGHATTRQVQRHKYAKSGLSEQQMLIYKRSLRQAMEEQQVHLRPDLTLPKLAEVVGCSVNHLSQVINAGFGMSFFDYLNKYRIDYAKHLLTTLNARGNAILNIAFTVGFNSNSAFYAAFKKCVGQTPAQFRRSHLQKQH